MQSVSRINLELFWKGAYTYPGWDIMGVELNTNEVSASIHTDLPSTQEQQLKFRVSKKEFFSLECPIAFVKSMTVYVKIFRPAMWGDDLDCPLPDTEETRLSVFMGSLPEFQPNHTYQIRVVNRGGTSLLIGTIEEKVTRVATCLLELVEMAEAQRQQNLGDGGIPQQQEACVIF